MMFFVVARDGNGFQAGDKVAVSNRKVVDMALYQYAEGYVVLPADFTRPEFERVGYVSYIVRSVGQDGHED